jgi:hypothetical protein
MAEQLGDDVVLRAAPESLVRRLLDGVLILGPSATEPLRCSEPGDVLWSMLSEPRPVGELVKAWAALFGLAQHEARSDIAAILAAWLDAGAITATAESPTP